MYRKTITYENFNGEKVSDTYCFHMNPIELFNWASSTGADAGYAGLTKEAVDGKTIKDLMQDLESLLRTSIGTPSSDGKRFIKNDEVREEFFESNAYPTYIMQLANDQEEINRFLDGVFPGDLNAAIARVRAEQAAEESKK